MSRKMVALSLIVALLFAFSAQTLAAGEELLAARDGRTNVNNMNDTNLNPMNDDTGMTPGTRGINNQNRINDPNTGMRGMNDGFRATATGNETNWGWLGLLGLIGLAGMFGRNRAEERR